MTTKQAKLDTAEIRALAVEFSVAPQSIEKVLAGGTVRGLAGHRIRAGLSAKGLMHLAPHLQSLSLGGATEQAGMATDPEAIVEI
jgi:hypothetical protein